MGAEPSRSGVEWIAAETPCSDENLQSADGAGHHSCATSKSLLRLCRVKGLKGIVTMLLLAIWLPATSHSLLELSGLIHQEHHVAGDADSDSDHDHDVADGVCAMVSAATPLIKVTSSTPLFYFAAYPAVDFSAIDQQSQSLPLNGLGTSPPLLPSSWQFIHRAAIPARAPSFVS